MLYTVFGFLMFSQPMVAQAAQPLEVAPTRKYYGGYWSDGIFGFVTHPLSLACVVLPFLMPVAMWHISSKNREIAMPLGPRLRAVSVLLYGIFLVLICIFPVTFVPLYIVSVAMTYHVLISAHTHYGVNDNDSASYEPCGLPIQGDFFRLLLTVICQSLVLTQVMRHVLRDKGLLGQDSRLVAPQEASSRSPALHVDYQQVQDI